MRYPDADWRPSPNVVPGNQGRLAVVVHIAEGGYAGSLSWLTNPASGVSSHFLISETGHVAQLVELGDSAWANGLRWTSGVWRNARGKVVRPTWRRLTAPVNPNLQTISVELAGFHGKPRPEAQVNALVSLLVWLARAYRWPGYEVGENLIGHRHIDPADKSFCPGPHVDLDAIGRAASVALMPPAPPRPAVYTADSPIIGRPLGTADAAIRWLAKRSTRYDAGAVGEIVAGYEHYGGAAGVDWFLALAQLAHETGNLTSWWCARPRRNPAGLGVTGHSISAEQRAISPSPFPPWQWALGDDGRWYEGLSFAAWVPHSITAHLGRLLAYALPQGQGTAAQLALIETALRLRPLPPSVRGVCRDGLRGLDGIWNAEPTGYPATVANLANAMREGR